MRTKLALVATWWRRHRRQVTIQLLVCAFFFLLGRFSQQSSSPLMCKIYG